MSETLNHNPNLKILSAAPEDAEGIGIAQFQSWQETYVNEELGIDEDWIRNTVGFLTEEKGNSFKRNMIKEANKPNSDILYLVVKDEEKNIKGFLHVTRRNSFVSFDAIYLTKDTHGSGIASQLMERAIEFAGNLPMELEVASYNDRAIRFYEKYGFKVGEQLPEKFHGKIPLVKMKRGVSKNEV